MSNRPGPIFLINPNSSPQTTRDMVALAGERARGCPVIGATTQGGPDVITDEPALDRAAVAVLDHRLPANCAGVIVAAFGDPGLQQLKAIHPIPVVGIAEASMKAAAVAGRRFSVATTTPLLADRITLYAQTLGMADNLVSVRITPGDPLSLMAESQRLKEALSVAAGLCIKDGAEAIIIGGGPLATVARELVATMTVPIIEPVPEAVSLLLKRIAPA